MTDKIVVLCTCSTSEEARRLAGSLIEKRLAACVNLLPPVRSIYHWKGAVEEGEETLMIIKASRPLFEKLRPEIERLHSYEEPEIVGLPIVDGSESCLAWLDRGLDHPEQS